MDLTQAIAMYLLPSGVTLTFAILLAAYRGRSSTSVHDGAGRSSILSPDPPITRR